MNIGAETQIGGRARDDRRAEVAIDEGGGPLKIATYVPARVQAVAEIEPNREHAVVIRRQAFAARPRSNGKRPPYPQAKRNPRSVRRGFRGRYLGGIAGGRVVCQGPVRAEEDRADSNCDGSCAGESSEQVGYLEPYTGRRSRTRGLRGGASATSATKRGHRWSTPGPSDGYAMAALA